MNDCPRQNPAYRSTPNIPKAPVKRGFSFYTTLLLAVVLQMLLQKRNNSYYFRYTYPPEIRVILGRRELCRSLRTPNKLLAQSKSARYFTFVAAIKDIHSKMSGLTPLQFKKLIQEASENLEADLAMTRASESTQMALESLRVEMYTLEEYWNSEDGEFEVAPVEAFVRLVSQSDYEGENIETIEEKIITLKVENFNIEDDQHWSFLIEDNVNKAIEI